MRKTLLIVILFFVSVTLFASDLYVPGGSSGIQDSTNSNVGIGRIPTSIFDIYNLTDDIAAVFETDKSDGAASLYFRNDAQDWRIGVNSSDEFYIYDFDNAFTVLRAIPNTFTRLNAATYVQIVSGTAQSQYFDCGNHFYWRDVDASNAVRMQLNTATGLLTLNGALAVPSIGNLGNDILFTDNVDFTDNDISAFHVFANSTTGTPAFRCQWNGVNKFGMTYSNSASTGSFVTSMADGATPQALLILEANTDNPYMRVGGAVSEFQVYTTLDMSGNDIIACNTAEIGSISNSGAGVTFTDEIFCPAGVSVGSSSLGGNNAIGIKAVGYSGPNVGLRFMHNAAASNDYGLVIQNNGTNLFEANHGYLSVNAGDVKLDNGWKFVFNNDAGSNTFIKNDTGTGRTQFWNDGVMALEIDDIQPLVAVNGIRMSREKKIILNSDDGSDNYIRTVGEDLQIYRQGVNVLNFNDSGALFSSSHVGIGTTSPYADLEVRNNYTHSKVVVTGGDDINYDPMVVFRTGNAPGTNYTVGVDNADNKFKIYSAEGVGETSEFVMDYDGRIGLGTTTPGAKLQVKAENFNPSTNTSSSIIVSGGTAGNGEYTGGIGFFMGDGGADRAAISAVQDGSDADQLGLAFFVHPSATGIDPKVEAMRVDSVGRVGIGTADPDEKLTVAGKIKAREVVVTATAGADFVFEEDYDLKPLAEVEKFVKKNKHLPEIPSAKEMVKNGVSVNELQIKLLQKVEELTLHMIKLENENKQLKERLLKLESNN